MFTVADRRGIDCGIRAELTNNFSVVVDVAFGEKVSETGAQAINRCNARIIEIAFCIGAGPMQDVADHVAGNAHGAVSVCQTHAFGKTFHARADVLGPVFVRKHLHFPMLLLGWGEFPEQPQIVALCADKLVHRKILRAARMKLLWLKFWDLLVEERSFKAIAFLTGVVGAVISGVVASAWTVIVYFQEMPTTNSAPKRPDSSDQLTVAPKEELSEDAFVIPPEKLSPESPSAEPMDIGRLIKTSDGKPGPSWPDFGLDENDPSYEVSDLDPSPSFNKTGVFPEHPQHKSAAINTIIDGKVKATRLILEESAAFYLLEDSIGPIFVKDDLEFVRVGRDIFDQYKSYHVKSVADGYVMRRVYPILFCDEGFAYCPEKKHPAIPSPLVDGYPELVATIFRRFEYDRPISNCKNSARIRFGDDNGVFRALRVRVGRYRTYGLENRTISVWLCEQTVEK